MTVHSFTSSPASRPPRRGGARAGQMLEEYVLLLGLIVVPALAVLPALAAALRDWLAQALAWWSLPIP